ncbi:MAG: ArgE/DapE family deacylase [Deltaproteobacteria bacterium]|nr:ArgE/DapE family deacylase [Deltaproteobacteria bacterium]MBW2121446.1 ArgE/DapE family deacylase [Deltaproteobacteria bacterium]
MNPETLLYRIESEETEIVNLCQRLTQIPSENPPGDTREIVAFLESLFEEKGLEFRVYAPQTNMPNLVARIQGREKGRRLVFNGHLDTYPAGDRAIWKLGPFSGTLEEGRLFGRGVSDMKAGDTASIMTFLYLAEQKDRLKGEAVLTLVSDEETGGQWGTRWLLDHVPEVLGDAVLNGEPSACDLVNFAEKGHIWVEVVSRGRAAHGAYTHAGFNAIQNMYRFLQELESMESLDVCPVEVSRILEEGRNAIDAARGEGATDVISRITVNVGTISGGLKLNLVADYCKAEVDIRLPQGARSSDILSKIQELGSRYQGIEYRVLHMIEPNHTPVEEEIVQLTLKNAEAVRGRRVFPSSGIGLTDCRFFRQKGIPACVYGPRSHRMGAQDEFITVQDLMDTVKVHTLTAFDYLDWLD